MIDAFESCEITDFKKIFDKSRHPRGGALEASQKHNLNAFGRLLVLLQKK